MMGGQGSYSPGNGPGVRKGSGTQMGGPPARRQEEELSKETPGEVEGPRRVGVNESLASVLQLGGRSHDLILSRQSELTCLHGNQTGDTLPSVGPFQWCVPIPEWTRVGTGVDEPGSVCVPAAPGPQGGLRSSLTL